MTFSIAVVQKRETTPIVPTDYNQCPETDDAVHRPLMADYDPAISETHVSVMCRSCGLTTGWPIEEFEGRLDWN